MRAAIAESPGLKGSEAVAIGGLDEKSLTPRQTLTITATRPDGSSFNFEATCRLDTAEEISVYEAGGVLQRFAKDFLEGQSA